MEEAAHFDKTPPLSIAIGGPLATSSNYCQALSRLGAHPLVTLDAYSPAVLSCAGLLLPGGGDIHPRFFGQTPCSLVRVNPWLDSRQFSLLHTFLCRKKPVLGICKGMQLIHVYFGGSIIHHMENAAGHRYQNGDQRHLTLCRENSFLERLYGPSFFTNSAHHQCVAPCVRELEIVQWSEDGTPEAFCHRNRERHILGVQWHPERMCFDHASPDLADGSLLLSYFLELCSLATSTAVRKKA